MRDLKEIYDFFDKNSDGVISKSEFVELVDVLLDEKGLGKSSTILKSFDFNGNGVLDYSEFISFVRAHDL